MKRRLESLTCCILIGFCLGSCFLALGEELGQLNSRELISNLLSNNKHWLRPPVNELSYTFSMKHTQKDDLWEVAIAYRAPNSLNVSGDWKSYEGEVDNTYDPNNTAGPPRLVTILQGVTFFGPLQELSLHPEQFDLSVIGDEMVDGRRAQVLLLVPTGQPSARAVSRWKEKVRESATLPKYMYKLTPVETEVHGERRAALALECLFDEGPSWNDLKGALEENPTRLEWVQRSGRRRQADTYTAFMLECQDGKRPFIALDGFQRVSILPAVILEEGDIQMKETVLDSLGAVARKPDRYIAMRVGCGVWRSWYGYSGGGAETDHVWVDAVTGVVLREEGFSRGKRRFRVEYGDFEEFADGRLMPQRVVVSLFSEEGSQPWVFDMTFSSHNAKIWLLQELTELSEGKPVAKAWVSDVEVSQ